MPQTVQGLSRNNTGVAVPFQADDQGNQFVNVGAAPYEEVTRQGQMWTVQTATLFAPIAAWPSTTARLEGFNNKSGYVMVVVDVFAMQVLSTAIVQTYGVAAMVTTSKAAPTNTALLVASCSGKLSFTTTAASDLITAVDTTVVANGWRPYGPGQGAWGLAAATPGNCWSAEVNGKLEVPQNASICVAPMGSLATASSFQCGFTFYWRKLQMVP